MYADFGADAGVCPAGFAEHGQFIGGADVEYVQAGAVLHGHFHGFGRGEEAGFAAADQRMGAEWNGIVPVAGAGGGQIGPDGGLILAVCGDEPARQGKYSFQGFLRVHEHVAGGRAHEYLDAADTARVGPTQLSDIVIGGPYIKGVVGVGVPSCGGVFFFEGFEGGGRRVVVGHVHEGGGAAEYCCCAFGGYAAFGGGSRLAEMHLVVDDAGKEEGSLIVPYDLIGVPRDYPWQPGWENVPVYPWGDHAVWGLTGRITRHLVSLLRELGEE